MNLIEDLFLTYLSQTQPEIVIQFCQKKGRIKQVEEQVIDQPEIAYEYARRVIKGRWPEAEKYIATKKDVALQYAANVIKDRFPEYEKLLIAKKMREEIFYYCKVTRKRFPEAEHILAKGAMNDILDYANLIIKGRFELAEPKIITKPKYILAYAQVLASLPSRPSESEPVPPEMHSAMTMFSFQDPENNFVKEYFKRFATRQKV